MWSALHLTPFWFHFLFWKYFQARGLEFTWWLIKYPGGNKPRWPVFLATIQGRPKPTHKSLKYTHERTVCYTHNIVCSSSAYQHSTSSTQGHTAHMINAVVIVAYVCLFLFGVGTALAFLSSWRDGCLRKDLAEIKSGLGWVYLRIKKIAQQKNK